MQFITITQKVKHRHNSCKTINCWLWPKINRIIL